MSDCQNPNCKAQHEAALREVSEWQRDFKTLSKACGGILGAEKTKRELAETQHKIERLQEALADAPDMTCESLEARAWREKYARLFSTPPTPRTEKGDTCSDGSPRYQDDPHPARAREGGEGMRAHRGDPCLYCHTLHDDVAVGPCPAAPRCPPHAYPWPGRVGSLCLTCGAPRPAPAGEEGR